MKMDTHARAEKPDYKIVEPSGKVVSIAEEAVAKFFPKVDPGVTPLGARVLVQLTLIKKTTDSGIVLVEETRDTERANTAVARIVKVGPLAFRKRDTMEPWPEGVWVKEGDFVRVPRWGGDRITIPLDKEEIVFVVLNDHELIARIDGDPLSIRSYI